MTTNSTLASVARGTGSNGFHLLVYTDGVELTEQAREAMARKIGRVRQYAPRAFRARVRLTRSLTGRSRNQFRAHVLYEVPGNDVAAEHIAHHPMEAVDIVAEKVERRLRKRKTARLARRFDRSRERDAAQV